MLFNSTVFLFVFLPITYNVFRCLRSKHGRDGGLAVKLLAWQGTRLKSVVHSAIAVIVSIFLASLAEAATLSVSPTTVASGVTVTATWNAIASPTATDWIALSTPGAADTSYTQWVYVSCSRTAGSASPAGSCPFVLPNPLVAGNYELRLFAANGYTRLATSNQLTVPGTTLTASPAVVAPGAAVTATWKMRLAHRARRIG